MDELTDEEIAKLFGLARISFGVLAFVAPRSAAKVWTGEDITGTTAVMGLRSLGARDAALGLGLLIALKHGGPVRGWLRGRRCGCGRRLEHADVPRWVAQRVSVLRLAASGGGVFLGRRLAETLD